MKTIRKNMYNDRGSVIVGALMILALLTIIGFGAINMSSTEQSISTNSLLYERAFYTAEAGLQHAKETLRAPFTAQNKAQIASGGTGNWTFALNGSMAGISAATDPDDDGKGSYAEGVTWILNSNLGGVNYTVTIWNNDDGGGYNSDADGLIFVRVDAWEEARGGRCSIEELVRGTSTGGETAGYTAQEGAGSGKVYTSSDANAITVFDKQI